MKALVENAEEVGCGPEIIERGKAKLKDAEKAQEKKRRMKYLEELMVRREACADSLTKFTNDTSMPLDVDLKGLRFAISEADVLSQIEEGSDEVSPQLIARAKAFLPSVEAAHAQRRTEKINELAAASKALPIVDVPALRAACTEAEAADVDGAVLGKAHDLLARATLRSQQRASSHWLLMHPHNSSFPSKKEF